MNVKDRLDDMMHSLSQEGMTEWEKLSSFDKGEFQSLAIDSNMLEGDRLEALTDNYREAEAILRDIQISKDFAEAGERLHLLMRCYFDQQAEIAFDQQMILTREREGLMEMERQADIKRCAIS